MAYAFEAVMMLWIAMAAMAAAVSLPLLLALRRPPRVQAEHAAVDIYRDQLGELGRDAERGLIGTGEAAAARAEIARRLIRADADSHDVARAEPRLGYAAAGVILAMPLAALALYLALGSPQVPDQPLAARLSAPPDQQDLAVQIARVDQHLQQNPNDGQGWEVVAPVYVKIGRLDDAVKAYKNVIRLLGPTADRELKLGLATVVAANGAVSDEALAAFRQAAALAPGDPSVNYYLARALEDKGKAAESLAVWRQLVASAPADAPWLKDAQAEVARLTATGAAGTDAATAAAATAPRAPSAADIAAAGSLPPEQRTAMIEGMVSSLAARLETNSGDAQGWAQLVRSYMVLGRPEDARAALIKAKAALASDQAKAAVVDEAARNVGLMP